MKNQIVKMSAAAFITLASASSFAAVVSERVAVDTPRNATVAGCLEAIQEYHSKEARLFLDNKAKFRNVDGRRYLNVQGWVWKNGDRVRVNHQCSQSADTDQVALNVEFDGETSIARR